MELCEMSQKKSCEVWPPGRHTELERSQDKENKEGGKFLSWHWSHVWHELFAAADSPRSHCSACLMSSAELYCVCGICSLTRGALGWRETTSESSSDVNVRVVFKWHHLWSQWIKICGPQLNSSMRVIREGRGRLNHVDPIVYNTLPPVDVGAPASVPGFYFSEL